MSGEGVKVTIRMGELDPSAHKIERRDGAISTVDGHLAKFAEPRNGRMKPHITGWEIQWGDRRVEIPKGVYTSVFLPYLKGPAKDLDDAMRNGELWIGPSEDGTSLLVIMMCGFDAQHERLAFVITKEGRAHRFSLGFKS